MAERSIDCEMLRARKMQLKHDQQLERERSRMQSKLVIFTCCCLAIGLVGALAMFFLQGFGERSGFHLDAASMRWIGGATIGCVSTLAILVYKCFFPGSTINRRGSRERGTAP
jgi:hypothetical protein